MTYWKKFYIETLDVVLKSFRHSVGAVDQKHRTDIETCIDDITKCIRSAKRKDEIHMHLIVGL